MDRHRQERARHIRPRAVRVLRTAFPADSCDSCPARRRAGLPCTAVLHDLLFLSEGVRRGTAWCLRAVGGGRDRALSVLPMGGGGESAAARLVAELRVTPPREASHVGAILRCAP